MNNLIQSNIEIVLYDTDIFNYICNFLSKIYCLNFNLICKNIKPDKKYHICKICKTNNIFLPIEIYNNLYCYDCYNNKMMIFTNNLYHINKNDKKMWKIIEKSIKSKYIMCKYCNIKCSRMEWCHFHLLYRCNNYIYGNKVLE